MFRDQQLRGVLPLWRVLPTAHQSPALLHARGYAHNLQMLGQTTAVFICLATMLAIQLALRRLLFLR